MKIIPAKKVEPRRITIHIPAYWTIGGIKIKKAYRKEWGGGDILIEILSVLNEIEEQILLNEIKDKKTICPKRKK